MPTLSPNGVPARIVLAVLATAGILYANVGPVIVSGLALADAFNPETAGYVFSANMYGSAIGGFAIIFFVLRTRGSRARSISAQPRPVADHYYQLTPELINLTVAFLLWVGVPTALAVAWWSTRSGRLLPVCIGMAGTTLSCSPCVCSPQA